MLASSLARLHTDDVVAVLSPYRLRSVLTIRRRDGRRPKILRRRHEIRGGGRIPDSGVQLGHAPAQSDVR